MALAAAVWSGPALSLTVAAERLLGLSIDLRLRHAGRLAAARRHDAALRVYAAVSADIGAELRAARRRGGGP